MSVYAMLQDTMQIASIEQNGLPIGVVSERVGITYASA